MGFSDSLRRARERAGMNQRDLGRHIGYAVQTISDIERLGREAAPRAALAAAELFGDPDVYMSLGEEATGSVMVGIVLDGPKVDLHRLATGRKLVEEAAEALEALAKFDGLTNCRSAADLSPEDRERARGLLHQVIELQTCAANTVRIVCRDYEFSPGELYREHRAELMAKGFALDRKVGRHERAA